MTVVLTSAPAAEPISLAEAKAHLRIDADDEDALIGALIIAARLLVERMLGLALITQGWSYFLDHWPQSCCISLPLLPVQAVSAVTVHTEEGGAAVLDAEDYAVDALSTPARLVLKGAAPSVVTRAFNGFEVVLARSPQEVPATVAGLLQPYRRVRL